ncbi:MAG: ribosome small subunit-dependent GTPase A, partial [Clostridia bacterium]|nr:ribosome small subunit-dependent GTPase A [Clostridia bacterium]
MEGIIIKGIGGFYYIETADGIYECKARGIFRKEKIVPLA